MDANLGASVSFREAFVAELTDAALEEVARHYVGGTSIEQELGLWKTLSQVVARYTSRLRGGEGVARTRRQCEDFLAELAEAAYEVALVHGFRGPFPEVQLGLWRALRRVVREGRRAEPFFRALCPRVGTRAWSEQTFGAMVLA